MIRIDSACIAEGSIFTPIPEAHVTKMKSSNPFIKIRFIR